MNLVGVLQACVRARRTHEPSTLIFEVSWLILDEGWGLALRVRTAMFSLPLAIAMDERLNFSMSSSMTCGSSGGL